MTQINTTPSKRFDQERSDAARVLFVRDTQEQDAILRGFPTPPLMPMPTAPMPREDERPGFGSAFGWCVFFVAMLIVIVVPAVILIARAETWISKLIGGGM